MSYKTLVLLLLIIVVSGCTNQQGTRDSTQGLNIKIEGPEEVRSEIQFDIPVILTNVVESDINNVLVIMSNPGEFTISGVECESGTKGEGGCSFSTIPAGEDRLIKYEMKAPQVTTEREKTITTSVSFDYKGICALEIPIVNFERRWELGITGNAVKFNTVNNIVQSGGPIKCNLEKKGESEDTNFVYGDTSFDFELSFEDVLNKETDIKFDPRKDSDSVTVSLINFVVDDPESCEDFDIGSSPTVSGEVELKLKSPINIKDKDMVACALRSVDINDREKDPWMSGKIIVDYKYRYEKQEQLNINVAKPLKLRNK